MRIRIFCANRICGNTGFFTACVKSIVTFWIFCLHKRLYLRGSSTNCEYNFDEMDVKKRSANVTEEQKTLLLQFMEKNPRLRSGKFSADFTYKNATILWEKLTHILNSCNGVSKEWKSWRKCWQDLRSRSKLKQSKINAERRKTGGGSEYQIKLSQTEEATLNLISPVCIDEHVEIQESEVQIQPETEINFEIDQVEQNVGDGILDEHDADYFEIRDTETKEDKENANNVYNVNENSNETNESRSITPIVKKRKKKSHSDEVQQQPTNTVQPTQNLVIVAQKTYEMQNSYYERKLNLKKKKLELQERLVNAAERCNPS